MRHGICTSPTLFAQKVFIPSFCNSPFTHKSVISPFVITDVENTLTDLYGNLILQNNFSNTFCEINPAEKQLALRSRFFLERKERKRSRIRGSCACGAGRLHAPGLLPATGHLQMDDVVCWSSPILSHNMFQFNGVERSTPPQNCQLIGHYYPPRKPSTCYFN